MAVKILLRLGGEGLAVHSCEVFLQQTAAPAPQWQGSRRATRRHGDYAVKFADKEMQAGTKRPARRLLSVAVGRGGQFTSGEETVNQ